MRIRLRFRWSGTGSCMVGMPHPAEQQWLQLHLCSRKTMPSKYTRAFVCTFQPTLYLLDEFIFQFELWCDWHPVEAEEGVIAWPSLCLGTGGMMVWPSSFWVPSSRCGGGSDAGNDREIRSERQCFSSETSHRISGRWGYISSLSSPSSHGSSTSVLMKGISQCRSSLSSGNWPEEGAPWETAHVQIKWMGCPSRNVRIVRVYAHHHHGQLWQVALI